MLKIKSFSVFTLFLILAVFFLNTSICKSDNLKRGIVVGGDITAEDVAVLKSWNVNVVRYSMTCTAESAANAISYDTWLDTAISQFDKILPLFEAQNIKVVLNLFTPPGGFSSQNERQATHKLFKEAWAQTAFINAWQKISTHYKDSKALWAYDLLNEPAQPSSPISPILSWNDLAEQTATLIRSIDSTTPILMTPVYGKITRLSAMRKLNVSNTYYTVHFYDPWKFIHQGIYGIKLGLKYPSKDGSKALFLKSLRPLFNLQRAYKTQIYVGEFSVARWAPNGSGATYLRDIINIFSTYKFNWTYHSFRGSDIWDLEVPNKKALTQRTSKPTDRLKVVQSGWRKNSK